MTELEGLLAEQRKECGKCVEESIPVCCELDCPIYKEIKYHSEVMACNYCEQALNCKKRPIFNP